MVAYITELNSNNYKTFTESGLTLVDVWATWCGPCKTISPIVDDVSSTYQGKLSVGKLDADENKDIVAEIGVRNIPALIIYKDGEIVEKLVGVITKQKLSEVIDSHLS